VSNKGKKWKMITKHMAIWNDERFKFFHTYSLRPKFFASLAWGTTNKTGEKLRKYPYWCQHWTKSHAAVRTGVSWKSPESFFNHHEALHLSTERANKIYSALLCCTHPGPAEVQLSGLRDPLLQDKIWTPNLHLNWDGGSSNMLSMGEDLKDERGKGHVEYKDNLHQDAHHSFSMLSTMLKHGGGHATLHYKDRKGR
jgi:hypothetical protein